MDPGGERAFSGPRSPPFSRGIFMNSLARCAMGVFLLFSIWLAAGAPALAQEQLPKEPEALIAALKDADFDGKAAIVNALAQSGFPRAVDVINALAAGTLSATPDGKVVIESGEDGAKVYSDALTGAPVTGVTDDQLDRIGV